MTSPRSAASATLVPTSRPACSLSSHRTSSRSQYAWIAVPELFSAACAKCSVGVTTSITHSRAAVDSSTSWPASRHNCT